MASDFSLGSSTGRGYVDWYLDTASAWGALEKAIRNARLGIKLGFKRFDLSAPLARQEAGGTVATWNDLIRATLCRGVDVTLWFSGDTAPEAEFIALRQLAQDFAADTPGRGHFSFTAREPDRRPHGLLRLLLPFRIAHRHNIAVVDEQTVFVSRLGLTAERTRAGERDLSVIARGPVVGEALRFLDTLESVTSGREEPPPARRLLRTMARPARNAIGRAIAHNVAEEFCNAHKMLTRRCNGLIYIETHGFDDESVARSLAQRAAETPSLSLILVRSVAPDPAPAERPDNTTLRRQGRCLRALTAAFGPRMFHGIAPLGCSNVSIFGNEAAITGSADLSQRALRQDTGAGIYLRASDGVDSLRMQMMRHWLPDLNSEATSDTSALLQLWRATAERNRSEGRTGRYALLPG